MSCGSDEHDEVVSCLLHEPEAFDAARERRVEAGGDEIFLRRHRQASRPRRGRDLPWPFFAPPPQCYLCGSMSNEAKGAANERRREVIGIVGGLGPWAHLDLERCLLEAAAELAGVRWEQDLPEWILSSVPATPDRSLALAGGAGDPMPDLVRSLRRLEPRLAGDGTTVEGAGFAVIACHTAHAYLPALRASSTLPILDMVETTAEHVAREHPGATAGLLATTGTLAARIYESALGTRRIGCVSLPDLDGGERLQESLIMTAVYAIKAGGSADAELAALEEAGRRLVAEGGADVLVAACTELAIVLRGRTIAGAPVVDPTRLLARAAVRRAYGLSE